MKINLTLIVLFLTFSNGFSQSIEDLMIGTKNLYQANYTMDFEAIALLSYPKIEASIGKEALLEKLDLRHQNEAYRLRLQLEMVPFKFGPIRKIEEKSFCVVTFRNPMRYFFENKLTPEKAAEKATWLKEINNTKDVIFEPKRNSFNVKKMSTYIAVFDETTNNQWKFFNLDDPNQKQIFDTIFNESVKKELGL